MTGGTQCGGCGATVAPEARFCGQCAAPVPSGGDAGEELRQVTVLFSDASGYTEFAENLDPEVVRELMALVYAKAGEIVSGYGGRIDKLMGDAVLAVFGDPVSHEDDAERAARAALDLHAAVEEMGPRFEALAGRAMTMHSGINTGLVVTGVAADVRSGPLGDMVNVAARLQSLAGPGEVLVGPETRTLLADRLALTDLGEHQLKGRREPVRVARLNPEDDVAVSPSRRVGSFIGRQEELGVLMGAVDRVRDGESSFVTICGEAGAGKTRLLEEFRGRLGPDVQWLEGRAYPYTSNMPYAPIIDLLNDAAGIGERDRVDVVTEKLMGLVERVLPDNDQAPTVLSQLLGLASGDELIDLEAFRAQLHEVVRSLLDAVARRTPTVVCLQDLHWVDPSTAELLRDLASVGGEPLVTVCNFRPGFTLGAEGERTLDLSVLSPRQTTEQLASLLDGDEPPADLVEAVVRRTDGNPFFVEEIVNRLLETDVLVRDGDGWRLERSLDDVGVPSTIRGVIATRIDSLDVENRRVLREASVVGRDFLHRLVEEVTNRPDALDDSLVGLLGADLIREKSADPDLEYAFNHALTQEVAYEGLTRREREALHERVASAIELALSDRIGEFVETLAYHYERAGRVDAAVGYLRRSGRKALDRHAMVEADEHYRRAYDLLCEEGLVAGDAERSGRDRMLVELIVDWAQVHYYEGRFGDLHEIMVEHEAIPERVGDDGLRARWLAWSGHLAQNVLCQPTESIRILESAAELGALAGDPTAEAYAHAWLLWALYPAGRGAEIPAHWERLQALIPSVPDPYDRRYVHIKGLGGAANNAALRGQSRGARQLAGELLALGSEQGNRRAVAMAHCAMVVVHVMAGDRDEARTAVDAATAAQVDPVYREFAATWVAGMEAMFGDPEQARQVVAEHQGTVEDLGLHLFAGFFEVWAAFVAISEGHLTRGTNDLASCRDAAAEVDDRWMQAVVDIGLATIHARIATGEAEGSIGAALRNPGFVLRHARGAGKRSRAELHALVDALNAWSYEGYLPTIEVELAKLAHHDGTSDDVRRHAQNVLDLLSEEPDATFVQEAKALLAVAGG